MAEIDIEDVGMFLVHLTKSDMLQHKVAVSREGEEACKSVHDTLALSILNAIKDSSDCYQSKIFMKVLTSIVVTPNNATVLKELRKVTEVLLEDVKEKSLSRSLKNFNDHLNELLVKAGGTDSRHLVNSSNSNRKRSYDEDDPSPSDEIPGDSFLPASKSKPRNETDTELEKKDLCNEDKRPDVNNEEDDEIFVIAVKTVSNETQSRFPIFIKEDTGGNVHDNKEEIEIINQEPVGKDKSDESDESSGEVTILTPSSADLISSDFANVSEVKSKADHHSTGPRKRKRQCNDSQSSVPPSPVQSKRKKKEICSKRKLSNNKLLEEIISD